MPELWQIALTLLAGLATGILSGMFGVGGATVSTPAIRVLGVGPLDAVGTTLPSIFPSSVSGTLRYQREGLIRWGVVLLTGVVGTLTAVAGSLLSHRVPGHGHLLMVATAGLVAFTAWRMARSPNEPESIEPAAVPRDTEHRRAGEQWKLGVIAFWAGALNGLLGVGGGIVMVPAFSEWIGYSIKESVGTSLACVGVLAIPSTITHSLLGDINWAYAIPLSIAVIPGARIGAQLAIGSSERRLRLSVATALAVIAVVYAAGEIAALV